jgi:hypothetical protein
MHVYLIQNKINGKGERVAKDRDKGNGGAE